METTMITSTDTIHLIRQHGLEPSMGYKIKDRACRDLALYRKTGPLWINVLAATPLDALSDAQLVALLAQERAAGNFTTVFDCCCCDCATLARQAWTHEFVGRTGVKPSHGYWPECFKKIMATMTL